MNIGRFKGFFRSLVFYGLSIDLFFLNIHRLHYFYLQNQLDSVQFLIDDLVDDLDPGVPEDDLNASSTWAEMGER